jgi:hypothetical protein
MALLDMRGGYLYQHHPEIIPQGYVTSEEQALWTAYYETRRAK